MRDSVAQIVVATGWTEARVRDHYVIGTPDEVGAKLNDAFAWGITHLVCHLGGRSFTLWSDSVLDLFGREVLPHVRR